MSEDGVDQGASENGRSKFMIEQYKQLHEMRREYNRFIFQAPTIVVAVVGGALAFLARAQNPGQLPCLPPRRLLLVLLGLFSLVLGYWAYRGRILLRLSERSLREMEEKYGDAGFRVYPKDWEQRDGPWWKQSSTLEWWQRLPSTWFIVCYIFAIGLLAILYGSFWMK